MFRPKKEAFDEEKVTDCIRRREDKEKITPPYVAELRWKSVDMILKLGDCST